MHHFFSAACRQGNPCTLSPDESRHLVKVLRHRAGDEVALLDGAGNLFSARVELADLRKAVVLPIGILQSSPAPSPRFELAVAPTKNIARTEWLVEKAVEIGVSAIHFFESANSERKVVKQERMQRIVGSALKQSGGLWLPELHEMQDFTAMMRKFAAFEGQRFIAWCEEKPETSLADAVRKGSDAVVLIGPEGDFSRNEVEAAIKSGFSPVHLGEARLRTETAGLVALHTLHLLNSLA